MIKLSALKLFQSLIASGGFEAAVVVPVVEMKNREINFKLAKLYFDRCLHKRLLCNILIFT